MAQFLTAFFRMKFLFKFFFGFVCFFPLSKSSSQIPWNISLLKGEMICNQPGFGYGFLPLNGPNFFQLGTVNEEMPDGSRESKLLMLDYKTFKVREIILPKSKFPAEHLKAINEKTPINGELLHFDGKISTVKYRRSVNYTIAGDFVCQYDHEKQKWSQLVKVCESNPNLFFNPIGSDREDKYFYYAQSDRIDKPPHIYNGTFHIICRIELASLTVDTLLTVHMPERKTNLSFQHTLISPDGQWLVLSEHWDEGYRRGDPNGAPPRTYIIDIKAKTLKTCLIPSAPYGHVITADSKYLLLGSYEGGKIVKIDLEKAEVVQWVKGSSLVIDFHIAPSGNYFLIGYHEEKSPRKMYDVRSVHDLSLITSVFLKDLFPQKGMSTELKSVFDGRMVISRTAYRNDSLKLPGDILVHHLPEKISKHEPGSPMGEQLKKAETLAMGYLYAERTQMELTPPVFIKGKMQSVSMATDGNVIVCGKRDVDDLTWTAYVAKINPKGELLWEVELPWKKISDTSEGLHVATSDGGCIVYTMYYAHERAIGQVRLTRISSSGKIIYHQTFIGRPNAGALYIDYQELELLPDASLLLKGDKYISKDEKVRWSGVMSAEGVLKMD
jgi:hypothetical protein